MNKIIKRLLMSFMLLYVCSAEGTEANLEFDEELKQRIASYTLDKLFHEHHLALTIEEHDRVARARDISCWLILSGKYETALPYLVYAENYYCPQSLIDLKEIAVKARGQFKNGEPEKIRELFEKANIQLSIPLKDNKDVKNPRLLCLVDVYEEYSKRFSQNVRDLEHKQSKMSMAMHAVKQKLFPAPKVPSKIPLVGISYLDSQPPLALNDDVDQQVPSQENHKDDDQAPLLCLPGFYEKKKED